MRESDRAHPELKERAEKIQIGAERLHAFHRDEQSDLAGPARAQNFLVTLADGEPIRLVDLVV